jgi:hypothetical protein
MISPGAAWSAMRTATTTFWPNTSPSTSDDLARVQPDAHVQRMVRVLVAVDGQRPLHVDRGQDGPPGAGEHHQEPVALRLDLGAVVLADRSAARGRCGRYHVHPPAVAQRFGQAGGAHDVGDHHRERAARPGAGVRVRGRGGRRRAYRSESHRPASGAVVAVLR